jgi:RHS repeat-associated protein
LTKVEENSATLEEYVYDGDGKRIQVTQDSNPTTYIYSRLTVLYEENTTGTATYIFGPTGTLVKRTTVNQEPTTYYYHTDYPGSTRLVTDSTKNTISAVTYHPFGEPSTAEGQEHYLYTGKQKDATGLYYYGARFYDPGVGRFLTRDTKGKINRYSYCLNNPLKNIDPDGCESTNWIDGEPWNQESSTVPIPGHAHIPDFVTWTREDKEGNWALAYWFFAMLAIVTAPIWLPAVAAFGGAIYAVVHSWWGFLPKIVQFALALVIGDIILRGGEWIILETLNEGFDKVKWESGWFILNKETGEIVEGQKTEDGINKVWVHVPGEGDLGGHWEDDADGDGVAASVDDDDNDPLVGDEDNDQK